jgi:hypothetical protein
VVAATLSVLKGAGAPFERLGNSFGAVCLAGVIGAGRCRYPAAVHRSHDPPMTDVGWFLIIIPSALLAMLVAVAFCVLAGIRVNRGTLWTRGS